MGMFPWYEVKEREIIQKNHRLSAIKNYLNAEKQEKDTLSH